jgi:hypothetical protein
LVCKRRIGSGKATEFRWCDKARMAVLGGLRTFAAGAKHGEGNGESGVSRAAKTSLSF